MGFECLLARRYAKFWQPLLVIFLVLALSRPFGVTSAEEGEAGDFESRTASVATRTNPARSLERGPKVQDSLGDARARLIKAYGSINPSFEANQGQVESQVKFLWRGRGYFLFLTDTEAILELPSRRSRTVRAATKASGENKDRRNDSSEFTVLRIEAAGASPDRTVCGVDPLPGKTNYIIGNDPKKWLSNIPSYSNVRYRSIYPGIDLVYHANQDRLEYDFVVAAAADPSLIKLRFGTPARLSLDPSGDLKVGARGDQVVFHRPRAYQTLGSETRTVPAGFVISRSQEVGFALGPYDRRAPLVIDPVLIYSTYLSGSGGDEANAIALDSSRAAYLAGSTLSANFPTTSGAYNRTFNTTMCPPNAPTRPCSDTFITKIDPTGSFLVYSTFLGGRGDDIPGGIAVDSSMNAYVMGNTTSDNFPTTAGAAQTTLRGPTNAYVTKLNSAGSNLLFSTYLGGSGTDLGNAIAIDGSTPPNAYVTGSTTSTDFFTTPTAFQPTYGGNNLTDAFVTKVKGDGTTFLYSTYLGGSDADVGNGIAADGSGNAYVTGLTSSTNFPVKNAFQPTKASLSDAFVTKINTMGSASTSLVYSTYFGGNDSDQGIAITLDTSTPPKAYVTGSTSSTDFPKLNALQGTIGGSSDAFVAKFDTSQTGSPSLLYSTFLGGNGADIGDGIALDNLGNIYVTGQTASTDFPKLKPFENASLLSDIFITEINPSGSALVYSSYLGGSGRSENGTGIAVDSNRNVYVAGFTDSNDFPTTPQSFQPNPMGSTKAFVVKIGPADAPAVSLTRTSLTFPDTLVSSTSSSQTVTLRNMGSSALTVSNLTVSGDFAETTDCTANDISGAGSCRITVTFSPTTRGTRTGAVTITDSATGSPHTINLTGNGVSPSVTLSTTSLTFTNQNVGTTSPAQNVVVTNTGSDTVTFGVIFAGGDFSQTNNCGSSLNASSSCTIAVAFTPTAALTRIGTLTIVDNAPGSPRVVHLDGTGVGPAITLSSASLTFSEQPLNTTSGPQTLTVTNIGNAQLAISGVAITGAFAQTNNCGTGLAAGSNCAINVTFSPTSPGTTFGAVSVLDNAPGSPHAASLSGTAVNGPAPEVYFSSPIVNFDPQIVGTSSPVQALTLKNTGNATLTISAIAANGDFSQSNNCGSSLAAGAQCAISLTFSPTTTGLRIGTLTVTDNASGSPQSATLIGTGIDFQIGALPTASTVNAGQSTTYSLAIVPLGGFNQQVSLACNQPPPAAACSFSPSTVSLDGSSSVLVQLTVTTTARSAAFPRGKGPRVIPPLMPLHFMLPWLLLLLALGFVAVKVSPRLGVSRAGLLLLSLVLLVVFWASCSVGSGPISGTPPGTYALNVTGTTKAFSHTISVGLTVN